MFQPTNVHRGAKTSQILPTRLTTLTKIIIAESSRQSPSMRRQSSSTSSRNPLHDLYVFVHKLARLKGLYDAATQAAVQSASGTERMQFSISIKTPIVILPCAPASSTDAFVLRLGQIAAKNECEAVANRMTAGLHGIQLVSNLCRNGDNCSLKVIDDIDISTDIVQTVGINRRTDVDLPDTQVFLPLFFGLSQGMEILTMLSGSSKGI
jgi:hypothetical protein